MDEHASDDSLPDYAASGAPGISPDRAIEALEKIYTARNQLLDFKAERLAYVDLVPRLIKKLAPNYTLNAPINLGSTATVWEVTDRMLNIRRALKIARPRSSRLADIIVVVRGEPRKLAALSHGSIIKVYGTDELPLELSGDKYQFPYFLMDFFDDIDDLDAYILSNLTHLTAGDLISFFRDLLGGLSYLHKHGIIHCDIKPGNLLVANKHALVADLGYAKHLPRIDAHDSKLTLVNYTRQYAHPKLQQAMIESSDPNANVARIARDKLSASFDLFAFGRSMQEILGKIRAAERDDAAKDYGRDSILNPYQWRYLNFISKLLLDGIVERGEEASIRGDDLRSDLIPGLSNQEMSELKYQDADDAVESLEKLLNLYDLEGFVPELNPNIAKYIQIPHAQVPMTPRVARLVNHPMVDHLVQTTQLGFVSHIYPGASHTRFEHVLGTFARCCDYVRALWYDEYNCLFQLIMSKKDLDAVLLAALLHDIGQYPMAHDMAEGSKVYRHENLTEQALQLPSPAGETLGEIVRTVWEVAPSAVLAILKGGDAETATFKQRLLHSIISGSLDCDKLDYLTRDSTHLGVHFGAGIDRERLLRTLTIAYHSEEDLTSSVESGGMPTRRLAVADLGVTERGLVVAQALWRARRDMFTQVYWQHTARAFKAMLGYIVRGVELRMRAQGDDALSDFRFQFQSFAFDPMNFSARSVGANRSGGDAAQADDSSSVEDPVMQDLVEELPTSALRSSSRLAPSDDALLCFLWTYAAEDERRMIRAIREREPYLRAAIISRARNVVSYDSVYDRFKNYYMDDNLQAIEDLRQAWQTEIMSAVTAAAKDNDRLRAAIPAAAPEPIILVDVPIKGSSRASKGESLFYLPEDFSGVHFREPSALPRFATAPMELEQAEFDKAAGKIRVLAHPRWRDIIARTVQQGAMIKILVK